MAENITITGVVPGPGSASVVYARNCTELALQDASRYQSQTIDERYPGPKLYEHLLRPGLTVFKYLIPVWLFVGTVGNTLSLIVWASPRQRRKNSSAVYLAALALSDLIFGILSIDTYLNRTLQVSGLVGNTVTCKLWSTLNAFFTLFSILLVFVFTVERWIAVWFPFQRHRFCTTRRALLAVTLLALLSLILGLPQAHFFVYSENGCTVSKDLFEITRYFSLTQEILFSLLVPVAALVFNVFVLKEMHRINRRLNCAVPVAVVKNGSGGIGNTIRDRHTSANATSNADLAGGGGGGGGGSVSESGNRESSSFLSTTLMLVILSFYLILCVLPPGIVYMLQFHETDGNECMTDETIESDPDWQHIRRLQNAKLIIDALCMSHFACNFLIYMVNNKAFRKQTLQLLACRRTASRGNDPFYGAENYNYQRTNSYRTGPGAENRQGAIPRPTEMKAVGRRLLAQVSGNRLNFPTGRGGNAKANAFPLPPRRAQPRRVLCCDGDDGNGLRFAFSSRANTRSRREQENRRPASGRVRNTDKLLLTNGPPIQDVIKPDNDDKTEGSCRQL